MYLTLFLSLNKLISPPLHIFFISTTPFSTCTSEVKRYCSNAQLMITSLSGLINMVHNLVLIYFLKFDTHKIKPLIMLLRPLKMRIQASTNILMINEPPHDRPQQNGMCNRRRLRSAWAFAQFDQNICCELNGYLFRGLQLSSCRQRRLWSDWSESSLGAHAILLVLSWGGSNMKLNTKKARTNVYGKPNA